MSKQINRQINSDDYRPFGHGKILSITESTTFTAPLTGKYRVQVIGGGSSAAVSRSGGGGGYAMGTILLTANQTVTITIGAASGNTTFGTYLTGVGASGNVGGIGIVSAGVINAMTANGGNGVANTTPISTGSGGGAAGSYLGDGGTAKAQLNSRLDIRTKGGSVGGNAIGISHSPVSTSLSRPAWFYLDGVDAGRGGQTGLSLTIPNEIPPTIGGGGSGAAGRGELGGGGGQGTGSFGQGQGGPGFCIIEW